MPAAFLHFIDSCFWWKSLNVSPLISLCCGVFSIDGIRGLPDVVQLHCAGEDGPVALHSGVDRHRLHLHQRHWEDERGKPASNMSIFFTYNYPLIPLKLKTPSLSPSRSRLWWRAEHKHVVSIIKQLVINMEDCCAIIEREANKESRAERKELRWK